MTEKRKYLRQRANLKVLCKPWKENQESSPEPIPFSPATKDFSMGGVSIFTEDALPVGLQLVMVFSMAEEQDYIELAGEVTWSREEKDMILNGISFSTPSDDDKQNLDKLAGYLSQKDQEPT